MIVVSDEDSSRVECALAMEILATLARESAILTTRSAEIRRHQLILGPTLPAVLVVSRVDQPLQNNHTLGMLMTTFVCPCSFLQKFTASAMYTLKPSGLCTNENLTPFMAMMKTLVWKSLHG